MVKVELSIEQVQDLLMLVAAKARRVKETGDRPYWLELDRILEDALREEFGVPLSP